MAKFFGHYQLLRVASVFVWVCVGIPMALAPVFHSVELQAEIYVFWWLAYLTYGVGLWRLVRTNGGRVSESAATALFCVMTLAAMAVTFASSSGLGGMLMVISAALMPWFFALRQGAVWVVAQIAAIIPLFALFPEVSWSKAALLGGLFLGFSGFAFLTTLVAKRQGVSREQLRKANSELRATQALLTESTRIAERVRIARELHDLLGHHLTALSLNLEVASHLVKGRAQEHVGQAQSLAKLLLGDVREVVSNMRKDDTIDLSKALHSLAEGVPVPIVHLDIPAGFRVADPIRAQVLLRCAQEVITNSVRHADADNLWIAFRETEHGLEFSASDDGVGRKEVMSGNGLRGMAERLEGVGGELQVSSERGRGFRVEGRLPA